MKFDCIVLNSPYQKNVGESSNTEPLWNKFIEKSFELLKDDGYLCTVHPSGWRNIEGKFENIKELLTSKEMEYLEIHNEKDGMDTFGAETRYDWYVLKNCKKIKTTKIKFQDGVTSTIDFSGIPMIPNGNIELFKSLLAKEGDEKIQILHSYSAYARRKEFMSENNTDVFKYPCIYTVNSESNPTLRYSNTKSNGHFGIPKVIWSNGRISSIGNYVDKMGEYGLTEFAYAIVDDVENLENIKKALDSKEYKNLMEDLAVGMLTVNHKILKHFKKDFWKQFVDETV